MSLPSISIINFSNDLSEQQIQEAIRAVNRQITEDFIPIWGSGRILRLHAATYDLADENTLADDPIRGESVLYIINEGSLPGALGYHALNALGRPYGFVFTESLEDWTVTLSHEALELIVDPTVNIFVPGSDPRDPQNTVLHTYEVCDAVERTIYEIDNIMVSNFITPTYFTEGDEAGTRNDFLGVGVESFRATQGSHLAFYDLSTNDWVTYYGASKPSLLAMKKRAEKYEHDKPKRPEEDQIQCVLDGCKSKNKKLANISGITRMSRYKNSAIKVFSSSKQDK